MIRLSAYMTIPSLFFSGIIERCWSSIWKHPFRLSSWSSVSGISFLSPMLTIPVTFVTGSYMKPVKSISGNILICWICFSHFQSFVKNHLVFIECRNRLGDEKCNRYAALGYCIGDHYENMFIQCKRSCGFCSEYQILPYSLYISIKLLSFHQITTQCHIKYEYKRTTIQTLHP